MLLIFAAVIIASGAGYFLYLRPQEKQSKAAVAVKERTLANHPQLNSETWNIYRDVEKRLEFQFPESYRVQWGYEGVLLIKEEQTIEVHVYEAKHGDMETYERAASPEELAIEWVSSTYSADGPDGSLYATLPVKHPYKTPNGFDAIELYLTIVRETYLDEGGMTERRTEMPIYIISTSQEPYRSFIMVRFLDYDAEIFEKELLKKIADSVKIPEQAQEQRQTSGTPLNNSVDAPAEIEP